MARKKEIQPRRRYVDMWAFPGIHPTNVEFLQKMKTADTNHFTTHMDVVGSVSEQCLDTRSWESTHLIGIRTDVWRSDKAEMQQALATIQKQRRTELKQTIKKSGRLDAKQQAKLDEKIESDQVMNLGADEIVKRRLVLKLFKTTGERTQWCGTIEQVTLAEVNNSIGANHRLLTMVAMLPRNEMVTYVQQHHRTLRIPSLFTIGFIDVDRIWNIVVRRRWISIGADFEIEANGKPLGEIDGRLFSLGADSYIDLEPHELSENTQFADLLTLFTASIGYHKAMRKSVGKRVKAALAGHHHRNVIDDEELRLCQNGRSAA